MGLHESSQEVLVSTDYFCFIATWSLNCTACVLLVCVVKIDKQVQ
jgi:hypothetical protein